MPRPRKIRRGVFNEFRSNWFEDANDRGVSISDVAPLFDRLDDIEAAYGKLIADVEKLDSDQLDMEGDEAF